jgi:hypothetical protein
VLYIILDNMVLKDLPKQEGQIFEVSLNSWVQGKNVYIKAKSVPGKISTKSTKQEQFYMFESNKEKKKAVGL